MFGGNTGINYFGASLNDLLTLELGDTAAQWVVAAAQGDVPATRTAGALAAVGQQLLLYGGLDHDWSKWTYHSDLALFDPRTGSEYRLCTKI